MSQRNVCSHEVAPMEQQLGRLFHKVKCAKCKAPDILFESCDKTCSKIEKTWLLLVHWVEKQSSE